MRWKFVLVLLVVFCFSCKEKISYPEILKEAEAVVTTNPDSASILLSEIIDPSVLSDAEKADYGYLTTLVHASTGKAMAEDGLIIYALSYYKEHHVSERLAITYLLAAEYYKWNNNLQMRNTMLNAGLELSQELQDSTLISEYYETIAQDHYERKEYKDAICAYQQAVAYKNRPHIYYQIGLSYAFTGDADSMDYYINKSINFAAEQNDIASLNHYRRNYADVLQKMNKYNEALNLHKQVMDSDSGRARFSSCLLTVEIYLTMRQPDLAQTYIDSAGMFLEEIRALPQTGMPDMGGENMLMACQAIVDYAKGKTTNLQKMGLSNTDYWQKVRTNELLIEEKIELKNRLEQQNLMLTIRSQRMQLCLAWGLVALVLIAGVVFLYIRRKRMKLLEMEERREVLEKLLNDATATNEEDNAFFKKVLLQQLGLIKLVASTPTNHNQDLLKQVSLIHNKDVQTDDMLVWDDLYKLINSIYNGFYTRMISKYGGVLTEKEKQLCCLLCAGFSTKEISVIIQQGVQTIYQRKTTIRQKLKMDEKEDIVDFIKN